MNKTTAQSAVAYEQDSNTGAQNFHLKFPDENFFFENIQSPEFFFLVLVHEFVPFQLRWKQAKNFCYEPKHESAKP